MQYTFWCKFLSLPVTFSQLKIIKLLN